MTPTPSQQAEHGPVVWVGRDLHHYPVWAESEKEVLREAVPYVPRAELERLQAERDRLLSLVVEELGHELAVSALSRGSVADHGMLPGSHERAHGPECRCGRPWPCADASGQKDAPA